MSCALHCYAAVRCDVRILTQRHVRRAAAEATCFATCNAIIEMGGQVDFEHCGEYNPPTTIPAAPAIISTTQPHIQSTSSSVNATAAVQSTEPVTSIEHVMTTKVMETEAVQETPVPPAVFEGCGDGRREEVASACWEEGFGGVKMCSDSEAMVQGEGGRWLRVEECDDGNRASGTSAALSTYILAPGHSP